PIEELVKEFYSNAWFIGAELKCWVRGKDFIITPDYLAKILQMNHLVNVNTSHYDDKFALIVQILETIGADLEVSSIGTSIGTSRFELKMKTLTLIMYSNLLIMKILTFKGIHPLKNGTVLPRQGPISLHSLQTSKVHSSAERAKKIPSRPLKSDSKISSPTSPIGRRSAAPRASPLPETLPPHILEPQPSNTQSQLGPSIPHMDRMMTLIEGLHERTTRLTNIMYSHNNHIQIRLTTIEI
ncbi:hypothetical protein SO802_002570, partial [Lithocarpus litseifolius]